MVNIREELIKRNEKIIRIPMPNFSEMTNEELEKRANFWEKSFEMAFNEDGCEVADI